MNKPVPDLPIKMKCSYCSTLFVVTDRRLLPFCSRRCKEVDLSNWLGENYGLPFEGSAEDEPAEANQAAPRHYYFDDADND